MKKNIEHIVFPEDLVRPPLEMNLSVYDKPDENPCDNCPCLGCSACADCRGCSEGQYKNVHCKGTNKGVMTKARKQRKQQIFDTLIPVLYKLRMVDTDESIKAFENFVEVTLVDEFEKGITWDGPSSDE